MATAPLGPILESALKQDTQGGTLTMQRNHIIYPRFFCCVSGTTVGVDKEPVARKISSVTRVCTGDAVCIDFSKSWSPSSTIASWSVDWGDGNVSNGVWPGPGIVCHPLGGYVLPGVYTVVLTVTDLLGATGTDTQEIEVIDCSELDLELFAGCGSSGVWRSLNAGVSWENVSTETLLNTEIYDLKVHPFTIGTDHLELWAATEKGLYKSADAAGSWARITLPDPDDGGNEPGVASIVCSTVEPDEIYVLAHRDTSPDEVWLFRTIDSGETWTYRLLTATGLIPETIFPGSVGRGDLQVWNNQLYASAQAAPGVKRRNSDGTWTVVGAHPANRIEVHYGELWSAAPDLRRYNGINWTVVEPTNIGDSLAAIPGGRLLAVFTPPPPAPLASWLLVYREGIEILRSQVPMPPSDRRTIRRLAGYDWTYLATTYVTPWDGVPHQIRRCCTWPVEFTFPAICAISTDFVNYQNAIYVSISEGGIAQLYRRERVGQLWFSTGSPLGITINTLYVRDAESGGKELYAVVRDGLFRYYGGAWIRVVDTGAFIPHGAAWFDGSWFLTGKVGFDVEVWRVGGADLDVPAVGRTHLLSTSADGRWVYVSILDGSGNPIVLRVQYDLEIEPLVIHEPGAGTWGGVRCDYSHPERVWVFGDFGAASKVLLSDDWGDTYVDVTEGTWAANEVVRAILPSIYGYNNVIAILSTDQESWQSGDAGTTWVKTGDLPYGVHCGERDWIEDFNVFVGRVNAGAEHIRFSPNNGVHWYERSGGFEPNAPVTALQITA